METLSQYNHPQKFHEEHLNKQAEANFHVYQKHYEDKLAHYFKNESSQIAYYDENDFANKIENTQFKKNARCDTQEIFPVNVSTREDLNLNQHYYNGYKQDIANSNETIPNISFENMYDKYKKSFDNVNKETCENVAEQQYYFNENKKCYIDANEKENYINNQTKNQPTYTQQDFPKIEHYMYNAKSQQTIHADSQQNFANIYQDNVFVNSSNALQYDSHQNVIHALQNTPGTHYQKITSMQPQTKTKMKEKNYTIYPNQEVYSDNKNEYIKIENMQNVNVDRNSYEHSNSNGNVHGVEENNEYKAKGNHVYEHVQDSHINISDIGLARHNDKGNNYYMQHYTNGNNADMLSPINKRDYYLNNFETPYGEYHTSTNYSKTCNNDAPVLIYPEVMKKIQAHYVQNESEENGHTQIQLREQTVQPTHRFMKIRATNAQDENVNYHHHLIKQPHKQHQQEVYKFANNNSHENMPHYVQQIPPNSKIVNGNFYKNASISLDTDTNIYENSNNTYTYSIYNKENNKNNVDIHGMVIAHQETPMMHHNKYLEENSIERKLKSGKEYLNSQTSGCYNKQDIKNFMLEPKLYTKMDLDLPELIDGITTNHDNGLVTNTQKESIIKYKDTWRLVPGRTFAINGNEFKKTLENPLESFQRYLDMSNEKTQRMLKNSNFNALTGELMIQPDANLNENINPNKVYSYNDPAAAFPSFDNQPFLGNSSEKGNVGMLNQTMVDGIRNMNSYITENKYIPINGLNTMYGVNNLSQLNEITGASELNIIAGLNNVPQVNRMHFPIKKKISLLPNEVVDSTMDGQKLNKMTIKNQILSLCDSNRLKHNIKSFIGRMNSDYFKIDKLNSNTQ